MKTRWAFSVRAQGKDLELDIYDVIGGGLFGGITAKDVRDQLKVGKDAGQILVRLNSAGGDVTEGLAIYSLLREASEGGAKVTCRIDGLCASIATVIACAGDVVEMADSAFFMVHNPFAFVEGGASDLRSTADLLDAMRVQMLAIYGAKTGLSVEELSALCDAETWLTAEQALAKKFVSKVVPARSARMAAQAKWDLSQFRNVPKGLGELKMTEEEVAALKAELEALRAKNAELEAKLKASDDPSEEEEEETPEAKASDEEEGAKAAVIAAAMAATGCKDLEALPGHLMALQVKAKGAPNSKALHAQRVDKLIAEGKLMPSQREWALASKPKALDAFVTSLGDAVLAPIGQQHKEADEAKARAKSGTDGTDIKLTAQEEEMCRNMGHSPEAFLAHKRAHITSGRAA